MGDLPKTYRKLTHRKFSTDFRSAVIIDTVEMCRPKDEEICVRNRFVGINAFDINLTKGHPFPNDTLPCDIGLEGIGEVVQVGKGVTNINLGDAVAYYSFRRNAYAEYSCLEASHALIVPEVKPEYLVLVCSGLTATIGLDENARIQKGETVLITAAAGGLGHLAVQWAKAAGCHVIGTCSTDEKVEVLKSLGCDRIINYKKEDIRSVLRKEYPKGIDVIWETIGGAFFEACVQNLAVKGRLLVVGGISGYKEENKEACPRMNIPTLPETVMFRSAAVQGFMMLHYTEHFPSYFKCMLERVKCGMLKTLYDFGVGKEFVGMEGVIDAIEYLYTGKSIGKVLVKIP